MVTLKKRIVTAVLAVVMMLSMSTVAFAASGSLAVYVENVYTSVNNAYTDKHNNVYVDCWDDVLAIFPEAVDYLCPDPDNDVCLNDLADKLGYALLIKNNKVYLNRLETDDGEDNTSGPLTTAVNVYRNGMYVSNAAYHYKNNESTVFVGFPLEKSLSEIFGVEPLKFSAFMPLQQWSVVFNYHYFQYEDNVYLNNDGKTPILVMFNGECVSFPDQQPIIVEPGYTMIPVYTLGTLLGCNVEWVGNSQVDITSSNHSITLYVGNPAFEVDGQHLKMPIAPIIKGERTLVPARFIVEAFGLNIWYDTSMLPLGGPGIVHIVDNSTFS